MSKELVRLLPKMAVVCLLAAVPATVFALPSVYPTGTTIYKPDKAWSGFTIIPAPEGNTLIDMNGNVVKVWKGVEGFPPKLLPGGQVLGHVGTRPNHQDDTALVQVDWDGKIVWRFDKWEEIKDKGAKPYWSARQHHDYQREGNPVGYYVPGQEPRTDGGKTLILAHSNVVKPGISDKLLEDDVIYEVTWDGKVSWEWRASEHFDELGFDEAARNTIYRDPNWSEKRGAGDWAHINSMSVVGPNKWYDQGDQRFHPDNIIVDGRQINVIWIIDRKSGKTVWKVGPDFTATPELRKLGQIIGQHHAHVIPKGLPGAGNILVFDNGGSGGFGAPNPGSVKGVSNAVRPSSRVLEFNPITLEIVWEYSAKTSGYEFFKFFSHYISSAQRLPNGNTLIDEGADGRIFEVTPKHEIVWEYVVPFYENEDPTKNKTYRAYRVPYEWVPQLAKPVEQAVIPPPNSKFKVGGPVVQPASVKELQSSSEKSEALVPAY